MSSCGVETHLLFSGHSSLDDRCERHKRASRAWSARWPASPKGRIESEPRGPSQLREVRGVAWGRTHRTVPITNRHDSSLFESFRSHFALFWSFWLAISEPGWTDGPPEIESHLESRLNQRDRATGGFSGVYTHRKPGKFFDGRGFFRGLSWVWVGFSASLLVDVGPLPGAACWWLSFF